MSNKAKYGLGTVLYSILIMFCTGSLLQAFLLECGFTENQVYLYNAMIQGIQVAVMIFSIFFSDYIKKLTRAVGWMHLSWLLLLFALLFLILNREGNIVVSIIVLFSVSFLVYCVYGLQTVEAYRLPYSIMDIKDYGRVTGIVIGISGAICFVVSLLHTYLVTHFDFYNISIVFFVLSIVCCVGSAFSYFTMKERKILELKQQSAHRGLSVFKNKHTYWLLFPNFTRGFATGVVSLLTVIGFSKGLLNNNIAPYMNVALQVATLVGNLIFAFACRKVSSKKLLVIGTVFFCALLPLSILRGTTIDFIIIYALVQFFLIIINIAIPVLVTEIIPYEQIGAFTAIRMAVFTLGSTVASLLMDLLISGLGYMWLLILASFMQLLCGVGYYIVRKMTKNMVEKAPQEAVGENVAGNETAAKNN